MKENAVAPVAFIVKGYPRLSETFIAQEIESLERRGLEIRIISLRHPSDSTVHPVHRRIGACVNYLPEYLYQEPLRVWRAWLRVRRMPGFDCAWRQWMADLRRDLTPNRVRRFGQAMVLAAELGVDVSHLHAHFLHTPASVARYAANLTGRLWSCSAHAKDIWTTPEWEKREKLADVSWLTTCSQAARDHLAILAPLENAEGTVILAYHGIDLAQFPPPQSAMGRRDGADVENPVRILSVGRAVAKKGYDDLIAALAMVPGSIHWRLDHIGGGALSEKLKDQAVKAGIADRVTWHGAQPQAFVLQAMRQSDVFILASCVAPDGDRDGLPNVLMEANSQGLACIATNLSAIPELIIHDETGLLVEPGDRPGLSNALVSLIEDPARRHELGQAGQTRVQLEFSHDQCIERLAGKFGLPAPTADADVKVVRKV